MAPANLIRPLRIGEEGTKGKRALDDGAHEDHSQDPGGQETGVGPANSDRLEHGRRVLYITSRLSSQFPIARARLGKQTHIVDGVDSSSVLHGKQRDGNTDSLEVFGRPEEGLDRTPEPGTAGQLVPLVSDFDLLHLFHEVRVVLG